jgi:hypothetical protein
MTWLADKAAGELAELALRRWFDCMGFPTEGAHGKFASWDFYVRGSVEVKRDRQAARTGNFFLEKSAYGKPSGIAITRATAWALVSENTAYFVGTEKLRVILDSLPTASGPDGKQGALLSVRTLHTLPHVEVDIGRFLQ